MATAGWPPLDRTVTSAHEARGAEPAHAGGLRHRRPPRDGPVHRRAHPHRRPGARRRGSGSGHDLRRPVLPPAATRWQPPASGPTRPSGSPPPTGSPACARRPWWRRDRRWCWRRPAPRKGERSWRRRPRRRPAPGDHAARRAGHRAAGVAGPSLQPPRRGPRAGRPHAHPRRGGGLRPAGQLRPGRGHGLAGRRRWRPRRRPGRARPGAPRRPAGRHGRQPAVAGGAPCRAGPRGRRPRRAPWPSPRSPSPRPPGAGWACSASTCTWRPATGDARPCPPGCSPSCWMPSSTRDTRRRRWCTTWLAAGLAGWARHRPSSSPSST